MPTPLSNGGTGSISGSCAGATAPSSPPVLPRLRLPLLLLRLLTFASSLAAAVSISTISSPSWLRFQSFRFAFAANAIAAAYSLFETGASAYEIAKGGSTLFPEPIQLVFDFAHDQVFAYMVVAAGAAGAADARRLREAGACAAMARFCLQADVSVALGFAAFVFLALASLLTGFRLACYAGGGGGGGGSRLLRGV